MPIVNRMGYRRPRTSPRTAFVWGLALGVSAVIVLAWRGVRRAGDRHSAAERDAVLHMGHGLNNTIQDVLTRWRGCRAARRCTCRAPTTPASRRRTWSSDSSRRKGRRGRPGPRGVRGSASGSSSIETGSTILEQLRAIGCSCDWTRTRFTLEPDLSRAVREVFVRLFEKGLIYRGNYIINWCPRCLTALSDEEAEPRRRRAALPPALSDARRRGPRGRRGCRTAVRTSWWRRRGRKRCSAIRRSPCTRMMNVTGAGRRHGAAAARRRELPVVADDVRRSGVRHRRRQDHAGARPERLRAGARHGIAPLDVMTPDAHMSDDVPERSADWTGSRRDARVVAALQELGLLERIEDHTHSVPHCYRCDTVVEPRLSEQWFVRMKPLAEPALAAARAAASASRRTAGRRSTSTGWRTSGTGASRGSSGGAIASRSGTAGRTAAARRDRARTDPTSCPKCGGADSSRTRTCSTRGSRHGSGRSRRSAGPTRPRTCARSTRRTRS
jgi:hypothetical protein